MIAFACHSFPFSVAQRYVLIHVLQSEVLKATIATDAVIGAMVIKFVLLPRFIVPFTKYSTLLPALGMGTYSHI